MSSFILRYIINQILQLYENVEAKSDSQQQVQYQSSKKNQYGIHS